MTVFTSCVMRDLLYSRALFNFFYGLFILLLICGISFADQ
jgi:hypothetical protein